MRFFFFFNPASRKPIVGYLPGKVMYSNDVSDVRKNQFSVDGWKRHIQDVYLELATVSLRDSVPKTE